MSDRPHNSDPNKCWCTQEIDDFVQEVLDIDLTEYQRKVIARHRPLENNEES